LKTRAAISTGVISRSLTASVLALAVGCATDPTSPVPGPAPALEQGVAAGGPAFVPGEVIVKFRRGASASGRGAAMRAANAQVGEHIVTGAMRRAGDEEGVVVLRTPMAVQAAVQALRGSADVEYAEPNWIYTHQSTSNDPLYTNGSLWGMYSATSSPANDFGSQAAKAWAKSTGSRAVYVGIIDEGVQVDHQDLKDNMWMNPHDPVDGRDNDGNGYVDDANGWDFVNGDRTVYDGGKGGTADKHGTHVAGTIGGVGGNGIGVVGVNWKVTMISGKFLGRNGGTTANAIRAVDYFTDLKKRHGLDIVATNNSWGGGGYSQALSDAIERANAAGILFIAAAGNGGGDGVGDNNDVTPHYPSSYANANIIAVASITSTGARSGFSNFGVTSVDVGAPGSSIQSTLPNNTYGAYSGTSMATPHVAGAVALYKAINPTASATQIQAAILNSATPTASLSGRTVTGGRLNVGGF
jgi:subtilisin family serine protease